MHYHWDLAMVLADTDRWWHGIGITLLYSVATVAGGIVIGVFCGLALLGQKTLAAESARGVSPRAAHRSGLDTLASSGSCHRTKAAASRRELELLLLPVGSLPTSVTCPLRSTGITPLPRYYGAVRPYPPHRYFRPHSFAACTFSLGIAG